MYSSNDNSYLQLIDIDIINNSSENDIKNNNQIIIDNIILNTHNKIEFNKNNFLNISIYSIDNNQESNNYQLEDIKFNIIVNLIDIIVKGDYDSNMIEVFYIFNIHKIILNELLNYINNSNNVNDSSFFIQNSVNINSFVESINNEYFKDKLIEKENTFIFQHNFTIENDIIEIYDFIFNNDIAVFFDNNYYDIEKTNKILYFHIEFLPDNFDLSLNNIFNTLDYDSIDFLLYKIHFKDTFIKIYSILSFYIQNINDDFFKYLFLKEFSNFLNIEYKNKYELIQFKESCLSEGEMINNEFNDLKKLIEDNKNNILIINYIKLNIMNFLT